MLGTSNHVCRSEGTLTAVPDLYWLRDKQATYAQFLTVIHTYCHPEHDDDGESYPMLQALARDHSNDDDIVTFKREFVEVIADPSVLPQNALGDAAEFDDGTEEAFLYRLWRDLYPDEPYPGTPPAPQD